MKTEDYNILMSTIMIGTFTAKRGCQGVNCTMDTRKVSMIARLDNKLVTTKRRDVEQKRRRLDGQKKKGLGVLLSLKEQATKKQRISKESESK